MVCREYKTAQKFWINHLNTVPTHHSNQLPLHLLSPSKETTSVLTKCQHTGHICCHASFHQGHGLGHSLGYNKAFHSSLGFHILCKNPLKRQAMTLNTFLHFNIENLYHNFIVKECQILKVLVNTYYILMRINKKIVIALWNYSVPIFAMWYVI